MPRECGHRRPARLEAIHHPRTRSQASRTIVRGLYPSCAYPWAPMARTRRSIAFGVILREYREAMKLSQDGLGLEAHLDRKFIWLLENGHRLPTLDSLFKLAEALQVAPAVMVARMSSLQPPAPHKKRAKRP